MFYVRDSFVFLDLGGLCTAANSKKKIQERLQLSKRSKFQQTMVFGEMFAYIHMYAHAHTQYNSIRSEQTDQFNYADNIVLLIA